MSSLRFWSRRWRSSLFCDHAFLDSVEAGSALSPVTFDARLYREIRSWAFGFGAVALVGGGGAVVPVGRLI